MPISRHSLLLLLAFGTLLLLAADPPKPKPDLYGDPLPDKAIMRLGTLKYRQAGGVMAFKKSGELVVVTGKLELHTFPADGGPTPTVTQVVDESPTGFLDVAISPDARYVAAFVHGRKELKVWDISGAKPEFYHSRNGSGGSRIGFSPDSRWLWMCDWREEATEQAVLCDLATKQWKPLSLPKKVRAWGAAITADGKRAMLRDEDDFRVFDTATGEVVVSRNKPSPAERTGTLSPDGKVLAWVSSSLGGGPERPGKFISVADGTAVKGWTAPTVDARWCGFTPGGKTLWVGEAHRFREWDPAAGKWLREAPVAVDYRNPVWSADGKRMACADGGTLVFLDADTWKVRNADAVNAGPTGTIFNLAVSPDGKTIATGGRVVHLWDAATGKLLARVNSEEGHGANVAFLPNSKSFLMVPKPDEIAECDARTGKELRRFKTPDDLKGKVQIGYLRLSADGKELSTFTHGYYLPPGDNRLRWDVATGEETARTKSPGNRLESEYHRIRSPDDRWLALGGSLYRTEDYPDKKPVEVLDRQSCTGSGSCWSADSTLVTFGKEKKGQERERSAECSLVIYDADKQAVQKELLTGWVSEAVFSGDGKFLGVVTPTEVAVWDVATAKRVFRAECPDGREITFTPDGKRLITSHGTAALVWDVAAR